MPWKNRFLKETDQNQGELGTCRVFLFSLAELSFFLLKPTLPFSSSSANSYGGRRLGTDPNIDLLLPQKGGIVFLLYRRVLLLGWLWR